jgi:hypothetical protein
MALIRLQFILACASGIVTEKPHQASLAICLMPVFRGLLYLKQKQLPESTAQSVAGRTRAGLTRHGVCGRYQTWYMYENNVPNVAGNVANPVKPELGANGALCAAGQLRCTAPEYAIV